jgi:uncharacterized protein (TIGR00255 family)
MTGFGRAEQNVGDKTFLIDIKSLNGKQFDLQLKMPAFLKQTGSAKPVTINIDLIKAYFQPVLELATELKLDHSTILSSLLKLPEVITPTGDTLTEDEWKQFKEAMEAAIFNLNAHRIDEGKSLEQELLLRIKNILVQQEQVIILAPLRQQKIREGLVKLLHEQVSKENYDENRLEQELIFYIEKIDITEEQVRLKNHCDYFETVLMEETEEKGKKLSFILQEIGREINTTGAKAYDSTIQKCVVMMKDELEKAKEQILNAL